MQVLSNRLSDPVHPQLAIAHQHWANVTRSFVEFPRSALDESVPKRFEYIARLYPDRVAIQTGEQTLTYATLNQRANRLARAIIALLATENEPVAFMLEQGAAPLVAILGILKANKLYVALDFTNPLPHLAAIFQDSQARLIVTNNRNHALAHEITQVTAHRTPTILNLDKLDADLSGDNLDLTISPDTFAAIFYTSGSSGIPKGVVRNHRNFLHKAMTETNAFCIGLEDCQPLFFSYSFSWSAGPIFEMLLNGAKLVPADLKAIGIGHLATWLEENLVTVLQLLPSIFRQLVEPLPNANTQRFPQLRLLLLSGEPITRQEIVLWKQYCAPDSILAYVLSSTEAAYVSLLFFDKASPIPEGTIPVGYATVDKEIALVDENGSVVGPGQLGEIVIQSRYLSPGYWRKPALTETVFHPDPAGSDKRLYFSGDLGRIREDGALEFLGRKDFQVKIRGHTVQINAVEMALLDMLPITEAVVIAQPSKKGDQRLIAYLVASTPSVPPVRDLRAALRERLPDYMLPSVFVFLDALPRRPNGKVDRMALPVPEHRRPAMGVPYVPPRTALETQIANIWADVLELDQVGVQDNFFELGGDSLSAMRMILEIEEFSKWAVPPAYLHNPTIATLAEFLENGILAMTPMPAISTGRANQRTGRVVQRPLEKLLTRHITANQALRWIVRQVVVRLDHKQGLRWLAWIGQPTIANRLYRNERAYFRSVAEALGNPSAATADAFCANVLGNIIWLCLQQLRAECPLASGGLIDAMHESRDLFWRSFANRVDRAVDAERGRLAQFAGLEYLYHAHKSKRGTILLTYHSPAAPIANALLSRYTNLGNIPTISQVAAQQMAERELRDGGVSIEERESAWSARFTLEGQRILAQGGVVQIVNDVTYDSSNSIRRSIGGRRYDLKPGFAELVLTTGAAVLPVYSTYDRAGVVHLTILPALNSSRATGEREASIHHLIDQYVAFLENTWRKIPESMGWGAMRRFVTRPIEHKIDITEQSQ